MRILKLNRNLVLFLSCYMFLVITNASQAYAGSSKKLRMDLVTDASLYNIGQTIGVRLTVKNHKGHFIDHRDIEEARIQIKDGNGKKVVKNTNLIELGTGHYMYNYTIPAGVTPGLWEIKTRVYGKRRNKAVAKHKILVAGNDPTYVDYDELDDNDDDRYRYRSRSHDEDDDGYRHRRRSNDDDDNDDDLYRHRSRSDDENDDHYRRRNRSDDDVNHDSSNDNGNMGNTPPQADAGNDKNVFVGDSVTMDGSGSSDVDGDFLSFSWSFVSKPTGSNAVFSDPATANPIFTTDIEGSYIVGLIVNDGRVNSAQNTMMTIASAGNIPPTANAGTDQEVAVSSQITLDGSGSSDEDRDLLTYNWMFTAVPSGSKAILTDPWSVNPTFVVDVEGIYSVQLIVNDGQADSNPDSITIAAIAANVPPIAAAGVNQNVTTGEFVTLNGSGSSDANNDPLAYSWNFTTIPAGSNSVLSHPKTVNPAFTADIDGTYVAQLVVNDGQAYSKPDTITIQAASVNVPPIADAGPNQNVIIGDMVVLDGSGSSDTNGDTLTFSWSLTSIPVNSNAVLNGADSAAPSFFADLDGEYVIRLVVNDGETDSKPAMVTINAVSTNTAPRADAGMNQDVITGDVIALDGSGSSDADGDPLSYSWTFAVAPAGSNVALMDAFTVTPSFFADLDGDYVVRLIVNDGRDDSLPDTVTIRAATTNIPPQADAGLNQDVATGDMVTLDASGSSDADGDSLNYDWTFTAVPKGSNAALFDSFSVNPTYTADIEGMYVIQLVVNDGTANSIPDTVSVVATTTSQEVVGQDIYDTLCSGCHKLGGNDPNGFATELGGKGDLVDEIIAEGHMGINLNTAEQEGTAAWLDTFPVVSASCLNCHGMPPGGTVSPDMDGSHLAHSSLPAVGSDCAICHNNKEHNSIADVAFAGATYNAESGKAAYNGNGKCSAVSCHGGQTSPDWWNDSINVNTQCRSCHKNGTSEYNSYNSGKHSLHGGFSCTSCHSTTKLATSHFTTLHTSYMEGPASATIGGSGTGVPTYKDKRCSNMSCHGSERW